MHTHPIEIIAVDPRHFQEHTASADAACRAWFAATSFSAAPGSHCLVADGSGALREVWVGVARSDDLFALAALPMSLPAGDYQLSSRGLQLDAERAALGFALGSYQFTRYRKPRRAPARLLGADSERVAAIAEAVFQARDLVNTPSEDMGPAELAAAARQLAERHSGAFREVVGDELLAAGFPAIHAVGRASPRAPRLIEVLFGEPSWPEVAVVGKGVCFDTGGLDIKPADGMRNMKKDMGGAAHALALAGLIQRLRLPVRLRLLLGAVDNAISGNAYRPGDVLSTRAGLSVEVDNTDAEGRIVLCDALTYAAEFKPALILDFATLTGAARVALGADLPPVFGNDEAQRDRLWAISRAVQDPLWPMPLWQPYLSMLDSNIADLANSGSSRYAGAITAALYLQRFVPADQNWLHIDTYAWNDADRPGRPRGGEALGLRAVFEFLEREFVR